MWGKTDCDGLVLVFHQRMPSILNESWRPSYHHVTDCVITGSPDELARNKSAIQSSTKQSYIAKKAVDGVPSTVMKTNGMDKAISHASHSFEQVEV